MLQCYCQQHIRHKLRVLGSLKKKGMLLSTTEEQVITTEYNEGNNHPLLKQRLWSNVQSRSCDSEIPFGDSYCSLVCVSLLKAKCGTIQKSANWSIKGLIRSDLRREIGGVQHIHIFWGKDSGLDSCWWFFIAFSSPQLKICVKSRLNNLHVVNIEVASYSFKASVFWLLFHAWMGFPAHTEKPSQSTQPAVSLSSGTF